MYQTVLTAHRGEPVLLFYNEVRGELPARSIARLFAT